MELLPFKQVYTLSIVMIGNFNPSIIQPYWFSSKLLIREQEAQDAKIDLIHPELVRWNIGWMSVEVTNSRFEIRSSQEPYFEPMKDLILSLIRILKETPITALGINHFLYFALPDEERYYEFGNKIVPLIKWESFISKPKLFNVEVGEITRNDKYAGQYRVKIQPSDIKLSSPYGILIYINDHYDLTNVKQRENQVIAILNENWNNSADRAIETCINIGNI
jgi:hypothetical protein